jgi:ABC-type nitrate/sulfonate/bicarbonate transport system substrate-binding protein
VPESCHAVSPLRVGGVPEHVSLPWYEAIESGRLTGVHWTDQPSGTGAMMAAIGAGELDVAVALTEGVVQGISGGVEARIVGLAIPSALQWGIHVAARSDFRDPGDLVGTRAAISRHGSGSHLMAYVLADRLGWHPDDDAHFVKVGDIEGARAALAAGDADYFLWDRFMTQPVVDSGEFVRVGIQETPWPAFVVVASNDVLERRGNDLTGALAVVAATAAELGGRDDLLDVIADRFDLRPETVADWRAVTEWAEAAENLSVDVLSDVQATLLRLGRIDRILPARHLLFTSS